MVPNGYRITANPMNVLYFKCLMNMVKVSWNVHAVLIISRQWRYKKPICELHPSLQVNSIDFDHHAERIGKCKIQVLTSLAAKSNSFSRNSPSVKAMMTLAVRYPNREIFDITPPGNRTLQCNNQNTSNQSATFFMSFNISRITRCWIHVTSHPLTITGSIVDLLARLENHRNIAIEQCVRTLLEAMATVASYPLKTFVHEGVSTW